MTHSTNSGISAHLQLRLTDWRVGFPSLPWLSPESPLLFHSCFWLLSCIWLFATPWTAAHQASLSFTVSQSVLKFMSIELMMPSNHCILCSPLLLLPTIFPSIRVFSNEFTLHIRWLKYWSFNFRSASLLWIIKISPVSPASLCLLAWQWEGRRELRPTPAGVEYPGWSFICSQPVIQHITYWHFFKLGEVQWWETIWIRHTKLEMNEKRDLKEIGEARWECEQMFPTAREAAVITAIIM